MSKRYSIYPGGVFFITLTVVGGIDVFIRKEYCEELICNLKYCMLNKGLNIYSYCIMPSHMHAIVAAGDGLLSDVLRDFKSFTSKRIINLIQTNPQERRKEWLLYLFEYFGRKNSGNPKYQFWQHRNHPVDLVSSELFYQKENYIHNNPVAGGIVKSPEGYFFSSANPGGPLEVMEM